MSFYFSPANLEKVKISFYKNNPTRIFQRMKNTKKNVFWSTKEKPTIQHHSKSSWTISGHHKLFCKFWWYTIHRDLSVIHFYLIREFWKSRKHYVWGCQNVALGFGKFFTKADPNENLELIIFCTLFKKPTKPTDETKKQLAYQ